MKLKYYLRGLGIGILVTALIMGATDGKELTDEEIKARAIQLGMVEAQETNVLSDLQTSAKEETKEESVVEESIPVMETVAATQETEVVESIGATKETETVEETQESAEATKEDETIVETLESVQTTESSATEGVGELVSITVNGGDSSVTVSNVLAAAGLVENAKEYDRYLCSNGYDKRICVGTYEIELGSDYETIAKIITKR